MRRSDNAARIAFEGAAGGVSRVRTSGEDRARRRGGKKHVVSPVTQLQSKGFDRR